jgi:2-polyprenyl-6-methoxyphenol hydroxylase-like FAD-dependent oxidoreductase
MDLRQLSHAPVLIVGGGPVGLATALELSFHGIACVIIEPRAEVSSLRPRARTTSARTMEYFHRWGIADVVRPRALKKRLRKE